MRRAAYKTRDDGETSTGEKTRDAIDKERDGGKNPIIPVAENLQQRDMMITIIFPPSCPEFETRKRIFAWMTKNLECPYLFYKIGTSVNSHR